MKNLQETTMQKINFFKAQEVPGSGNQVQEKTLVFDEPLPEYEDMKFHAEMLRTQGKLLAKELVSVLPQGVVDILLIELLDHTRSLLSVVHPKTEKWVNES